MWLCSKGFDFWQDTANDRLIEDLKFVPSRTSESDPILSHVTYLDGGDGP